MLYREGAAKAYYVGDLIPLTSDATSVAAWKDYPSNKIEVRFEAVGGYSVVDKTAKPIPSVAEFAVAEVSKLGPKLELISVESAETEVVAGINYRLVLIVNDSGANKILKVLVYEDLASVRSLVAQNLVATS